VNGYVLHALTLMHVCVFVHCISRTQYLHLHLHQLLPCALNVYGSIANSSDIK
jgi:hypothetical protein